MNTEKLIIEIGHYQMSKHGKLVCGDTFLSKKVDGQSRYVAVLSDGLGSGIKASVLSTMTASMALNFRLRHEPIIDSARSIMNALPIDNERNISYSTFTIIDVDFEGETMVAEYGNPSFFIERNNKILFPDKQKVELAGDTKNRKIIVSNFHLIENDRLVVVSDGITQSGIGNAQMPFGWGIEGLSSFVEGKTAVNQQISASELARGIVKKSEQNDIMELKDDASSAVIYRRKPRKLLLCSGPPYNNNKDKYLAETVSNYMGIKILCGGTTAKIVSRELKQDIEIPNIDTATASLPPVAHMKGVDLITEGILTLGKVAEMLENMSNHDVQTKGPDAAIVRHLMDADVIDIMIGTRINVAHQDPSLPVELEIRRNVIKKIIKLLEDKFLKQVQIQYI